MSYQVIARKYRPQRFSDVVGQEHVTQTLGNAIAQNRIAHAYIFVGPRGTGKTTIARIFAKCLNCTDGPKVDFSDEDPRCREITEGRALDVLEIDGASNRGIEEIRELRDTVKYAPATSKFKIYIIDEVHMLTKEAFNALLKTLEEPPAHVKFMFATTEAEKILPTILSRCQRFDLRRIPSTLITSHLASIAKQEKVQIEPAALDAIARGADGGMRDAESTLDQLISFCGDKIEETDVLSMFGLAARSQILNLARAILDGQSETALLELNQLARNGKDLGRLVGDLLNHFRNLLIFQVSRGDLKMLEVSEAEASALAVQSPMIGSDALTRLLDIFTECEMRLRDSVSKKILVEVALLKAIDARRSVSLDAVLQQLQNLRDGNASPLPAAPAPVAPARTSAVAATVPTPEPARPDFNLTPTPPPAKLSETAPVQKTVPESKPAASPVSDAPVNLLEIWNRLFEAVSRVSPFIRTYLLEAHPVSFAKNIFTIGFDPEFAEHIGLVDNGRNHTLIQTKLQELGFPGSQVKFIKAERPDDWLGTVPPAAPEPVLPTAAATATPSTPGLEKPAAAAPRKPPAQFKKEDFKNDPLIQKALEIFKGQIHPA